MALTRQPSIANEVRQSHRQQGGSVAPALLTGAPCFSSWAEPAFGYQMEERAGVAGGPRSPPTDALILSPHPSLFLELVSLFPGLLLRVCASLQSGISCMHFSFQLSGKKIKLSADLGLIIR